ncbi:class I SAM-dependent methyltransferase [Algibacter mikhailovii]|uniref:class I SAM-dependent methyltransferase n=1 Tax=Algibacter mikhailovii TaxID=425498 RepID=UPI002495A21F|nr:class I SAM-dependent methyltransferase [Algibacter mikhailovii]
MNQIYELHLWGGKDTDFYSGAGSHQLDIIDPYIKVVTDFLASFNPPLIVCDLGCGDFNIGKRLFMYTKKYIAVDIVEDLITRNKNLFKANNLEFSCLDMSEDDLPTADCVILRQVLQHLSNKEILKISKKIAHYKYIILTEHIPTDNFIPNKDIISGQGIRIKKSSGIDLLETPFNLKPINKKTLDNFILKKNKGRLVTIIYQMF